MTAYGFSRCRLDPDARELTVDGEVVHCEPQVFDVLAYLIANRARLVTKSELLDAVWGNQFVSESALTSRIKSARRAIGDDGAAQLLIRNERGRGYRFVGAVDVIDQPAERWRAIAPLPASRVPLVGRVDDVEALERLLSGHRVVTISGPGGVGKSTLALELARARRDRDDLDVSFVELAPVRQATDIVRAVAEVTGVEAANADDLAMLTANLSSRTMLLVLDNCEHVLDTSAELVDRLLDAGAMVRVLTTSREPLGIDGEAVHVLGSLGPDAPTLFVERATAATGRTIVSAADPDVVALCEHLDGLPLAIELAAAQLRHLTLAELVGRLDDRLGLLVAGRPRAGGRHATLATTIEWSYQLLSSAARDLFDRLGVFPASFDLAAVGAVSDGLDPVAATNLIGDLVAKSLVVHDHGTGRYRLLETIRFFARQRLEESGLGAVLAERVRRHVVDRVAVCGRSRVWLSASLAARSRDDIENVRFAFDASIAAGAYGEAVDIMLGLSMIWRNTVSYAEGLRWLAVLREHDLDVDDRQWLHIVEADLGLGSGNPRLMVDAAAAAIELGVKVDDPAADVIAGIYRALSFMGNLERPIARLEVARDRAYDVGEPELNRLARAFRIVALVAAGRRAGVDAEVREVTAATAYGYDRYIGIWAGWVVAMVDRDGPAMRTWMDRQADNVRGSGLQDNWLTMFCDALTRMADGGDYRPHLSRARQRAEDEGRDADADCVLALAYAAVCQGDPVAAAELMGACGGGLFHDTGNFLHHMIIRDQVVRPLLDGASFDAALARGSDRPLAKILSEHHL